MVAFAVEDILLHVLPYVVGCQWELSDLEEVMITIMLVAGEFIGSLLWGVVADSFGRNKATAGVTLVVMCFSIFSAVKMTADDGKIPGYPWILFCRFGIGTGMGFVTSHCVLH